MVIRFVLTLGQVEEEHVSIRSVVLEVLPLLHTVAYHCTIPLHISGQYQHQCAV